MKSISLAMIGLATAIVGLLPATPAGVHVGSVRQVLSRLLTGNDYILRSGPDGISIRLLGNSAADSAAASNASASAPGSRLVALRQGQVKRQGD
jgi:hypothetical protein